MNNRIFIQLDSSQAEARVCSLLARDYVMLARYDSHDIHALTASWFFGGSEEQYSKKVLGYECNERFLGKTLRHSGERGAKARRCMIEVNTSARKYRIPVKITEQDAESALRVFHKMTPNIEQVYFPEVIEAIKSTRRLIAPLPYGVNARFGGTRTFYERWGDELFREAFSYIPQRAVSDNTKAAGIRIKARAPFAKIILESHDALLFSIEENETEDFIPIAVEEMERPINFENCSLPRESLAIPCEAEIGYNYKDFKKFEFENLNRPVFKEPEPVTITDRFRV